MEQPLSIPAEIVDFAGAPGYSEDFATGHARLDEYLRPLLACGHYGSPVFECSSTWDFPDDEHKCPECGKIVQFHVAVQTALYEQFFGPVEG